MLVTFQIVILQNGDYSISHSFGYWRIVSGWAAWKLNDPFMMILIGRILQGVGAAGGAPIVLPLVGDMFRREKDVSATLGIIETSNTFGKVLSPILGSLLAGVLWFLPFSRYQYFVYYHSYQ